MTNLDFTRFSRSFRLFLLLVFAVILGGGLFWVLRGQRVDEGPVVFDGQRAFKDLQYQVDLGPRLPGTEAHAQIVEWIEAELARNQWDTEIQEITVLGHPIRNVIGRRGDPEAPWVILGAHFDTRFISEKDPDPTLRDDPVPGANDGASGVAALLEFARILPQHMDTQVWLVFFDAEDNGGIPGWNWILGSSAFVEQLEGKPDAVIILDMVADADLNIYLERNSDARLSAEIWLHAANLGYSSSFVPVPKHSMIDDHTPFLQASIPAVDIIDFDYPYHHTTADTVDKVSGASLQIVGDTVLSWLLAFQGQ